MAESLESVESVISTYAKAAEVCLATPGRAGATVALTSTLASDVVLTGDLHGHRGNFERICQVASLPQNPRRHLVLQEVCHGGPTYPENGGCMSHALLEDVAALVAAFPGRVHLILGNHELAELTDYPIQKNRQMLNVLFRFGLLQRYGTATEAVREAYARFLRSCPLAVRLPGGIFVTHSLPDKLGIRRFDPTIFTRQPEPVEYFQHASIFDMVWGRDYREENAAAFAELVDAKVLINGHEPCPQGFVTPNRFQVILDCCGDHACYVVLPVGKPLTQNEVVARIKRL